MKKICVHSGKFRTLRVITATLRNGRVAVASGGLNWAGREKLSLVFLLISSSSRVNKNNAPGPISDPVPDASLRRSIHDVIIALGNEYRLFEEERVEGRIISNREITDAANPTLFT